MKNTRAIETQYRGWIISAIPVGSAWQGRIKRPKQVDWLPVTHTTSRSAALLAARRFALYQSMSAVGVWLEEMFEAKSLSETEYDALYESYLLTLSQFLPLGRRVSVNG